MLILLEALSVLAAGFLLYHRIQQGRSVKRLRKLLDEQQRNAGSTTRTSQESAEEEQKAD